ncbi:alpha/beta hydrolase [Nocardia sp. alder85J]|uniref:alpha/beta hydrolase n=1 Tax=Nocardia sp. alder85J TaxID=2862949 RepID=UPI001CD1F4CC|nr:alpha/beta hydrolase [Nocardia sp. alder85J]MCX4095817.1 alpha/beta hydrolase [Nocardia sp. alder85J]
MTNSIEITEDEALLRAEASFAAVFGDGTPSLDQLRRNLDSMMLEAPLPPGTTVTSEHVGGVSCLRVVNGPATDRILLWFHGGGYVMGSAEGYTPAAAGLSRALGVAVLCPDYRLAPENPFPAALDDAVAVLDTVIATHGSAHTVVGGDSAGGGLTLAALARTRDRGAPLPAAAVVVSPLADFSASGESITTNGATDPVISRRSLRQLAASYLQGHNNTDPQASPVFGDFAGLPPILFLASEREVLRDDSVRMHHAVREAGGRSALSLYPNTCHAWTLFADYMPQAQRGLTEMADFVREVLR